MLDFLARTRHPGLAKLGTSCPDHFLRTKFRPLLLDLPPSTSIEPTIGRLKDLNAAYRLAYATY